MCLAADAATFSVSKTADTDDGACNADCSLREAIAAANANGPGADIITFNIPGGGVKSIAIVSPLPSIQTSLTINGATQSGYFGKPVVEINGAGAPGSGGLRITTATGADIAVTIIGLAINRHNYGVSSSCRAQRCDITLLGNFIGTDPTGNVALPNSGPGVYIDEPNGNITIGGTGTFEGNIISANGSPNSGGSDAGIHIKPHYDTVDLTGPHNVVIRGNKIGTNFDGNADFGNGDNGILVSEFGNGGGRTLDLNVTIGGSTAAARNIISGNDEDGIELRVSDAVIIGNYIGTDSTGSTAIPNGLTGSLFASSAIDITVQNGATYQIGGPTEGERNVISGNKGNGISFDTGSGGQGTAQLSIAGNYIGTNASGTAALGNDSEGVIISNATNYTLNGTIGGLAETYRNVISGNLGDGIRIGSGNISVFGNYIGTDKTGAFDLGNHLSGVRVIYNGNATIGGTVMISNIQINAGNLISGNNENGIVVPNFANFPVTIKRNRIGTNADGTSAIPNTKSGIRMSNAGSTIGSSTNADDGNLISGNTEDGILIDGSGTQVFRNFIGTNAAGGDFLPNGQNGIEINEGANNQIGLAGNGTASNIISGNGERGIFITGNSSTGNRIENNIIGPGIIGNDLGNSGAGVEIVAAFSNFVGSSAGTGNTIAFNGKGVWVRSGNDNEIRRNAIHSNDALGIDLGVAGVTPNDAGDADNGANRLQNFPLISRATPSAISGTLNSTANGNFTVDFYRVDACDASGQGEGRYYLGSTLIATDGSGNGSFNFPAGVTLGQVVTATATVTNIVGADDTSEFSPCMTVTPAPTVSFSAASYSVNEGAGLRTIVVNRGGSTNGVVSVDYATSNGTATAGQDYTAATGTLVFGDGELVKTFGIQVSNDTLDEPDETFNITLTNPTGGAGTVTPSSSVVTIVDNDGPPAIAVSDVSLTEGNSGTKAFTFQLSLSAASGQSVSVHFATADGTANLLDYTGLSGTVIFNAGETSKNLTILVNGDTTAEPDESFFLNLDTPVNATLGDAQGMGTILNDDAAPVTYNIRGTIRRANGTALSGAAITLSGAANATVQTDAAGRFIFSGLGGAGNYTVTPAAQGLKFGPKKRQYSALSADVVDADFTAMQSAPFDFDGDGKSDISIFRPLNGQWWHLRSSDNGNAAAQFGTSTDKPAPGDWTGDGRTDLAFWRESNGTWYILRSDDDSFYSFPFGAAGDIPAPADYDGDGRMDAAVFRPSNATWYIQLSTGGTTIRQFGANGDKPVTADYDGDQMADIAIFRPSVGEWWVSKSSNGQVFAAQFGQSTDKPLVGDYTGDGLADIAFWRPSDGTWFILRSEDGSYYSTAFGASGDVPSTSDFDGDGKFDTAIFRPSNGTWYINRSTAGILITTFGANGDVAVPAAFVP